MAKIRKHDPIGVGAGINPGRVTWVHNPEAVDWKKDRKYWWDHNNFNEEEIDKMLASALLGLTDASTLEEAWEKIFKYHNLFFNNEISEYKPGEKLAIKLNMNGSGEWSDDYSGLSRMSYASPVLIKSLLKTLVRDAHVRPEDITVFDAARIFPNYFVEFCTQGELSGVHFEGRNESRIDYTKPVKWSKDFSGNQSYFPECLTEAKYLINLANLKAHFWGVTLLAKNHFGTIVNENRYEPPVYANIHQFVLNQNYNEYSVLTDIILNYQLGEKTVLYGFDALIPAINEGVNLSPENTSWMLSPFNGDQAKSIFLSQDPIALDSVGIDFLVNEPTIIRNNSAPLNRCVDNYLHEAALSRRAPSGTEYFNGNGEKPRVIGIHEHWNNKEEKLYSKNLGKEEGIELCYIKI